ncbi:MAG: DUF5716 family protein [Lachnospiraceae bacterium]|nr:DUF5716 family protein [Lachnospiraceae bacterium]
MFEKSEFLEKLNSQKGGAGRLLLGIDLGRSYAQLSLYTEEMAEPISVPAVAGGEVYAFPAVLALYRSRFYAGFEAERIRQLPDAVCFESVFELALTEDQVTAGGRVYETRELLHHFLRLSLQLIGEYGRADQAAAVMFTTYLEQEAALQERAYRILSYATARLFSKKTKMYLQTRSETLFHFLLKDPEKLWENNALIFDYQKEGMTGWYCTLEGSMVPRSVHFTRLSPCEMPPVADAEEEQPYFKQELDAEFCAVLKNLSGKSCGVTWLIGEGFKGDWMDRSLDILLDNGRVFQGNQVYSLGACLTLLQMETEDEALKGYAFFNDTDIRWHIGLNCRRQGLLTENLAEEYVPVFEVGTHVGSCHERIYLLPDRNEELVILARSVHDGTIKRLDVPIGELADKPLGENRLMVEFDFLNISTLQVQVTDVGLGSLVPGSGKTVTQTFTLD